MYPCIRFTWMINRLTEETRGRWWFCA